MRYHAALVTTVACGLCLMATSCVPLESATGAADSSTTPAVAGASTSAGGTTGASPAGGGSSMTGGGGAATSGGGGSTTGAGALSDTPAPGVYQVATSGSDSTGNGSAGRPWRTISYALSHADYAGTPPTINVAAGTYDENLVVDHSVTIAGASADTVNVRSSDPNYTGYVIRTGDAVPSGGPPITVRISGVRIDGNGGKNAGLHAARTALTLDAVNVYAPGGFSVVIDANSPSFSIANSTFGYVGLLYSDVGIDVGSGTPGTIVHCTLGDHIDHAINIGMGCAVTIDNCLINGSPIYWADGIRVQGASNVTITNTTLIRPPGSAPASAGVPHNPPYAGIEVAASSNGGTTVSVSNCTVRGFDVGIGINMLYNAVRVQNCTLGGNVTTDVQTLWSGSSAAAYPVVDFGGGALGSAGGNDFGTGTESAVRLGGPYGISVFSAQWGVSPGLIEGRITDQLDDPSLGRVLH